MIISNSNINYNKEKVNAVIILIKENYWILQRFSHLDLLDIWIYIFRKKLTFQKKIGFFFSRFIIHTLIIWLYFINIKKNYFFEWEFHNKFLIWFVYSWLCNISLFIFCRLKTFWWLKKNKLMKIKNVIFLDEKKVNIWL